MSYKFQKHFMLSSRRISKGYVYNIKPQLQRSTIHIAYENYRVYKLSKKKKEKTISEW